MRRGDGEVVAAGAWPSAEAVSIVPGLRDAAREAAFCGLVYDFRFGCLMVAAGLPFGLCLNVAASDKVG